MENVKQPPEASAELKLQLIQAALDALAPLPSGSGAALDYHRNNPREDGGTYFSKTNKVEHDCDQSPWVGIRALSYSYSDADTVNQQLAKGKDPVQYTLLLQLVRPPRGRRSTLPPELAEWGATASGGTGDMDGPVAAILREASHRAGLAPAADNRLPTVPKEYCLRSAYHRRPDDMDINPFTTYFGSELHFSSSARERLVEKLQEMQAELSGAATISSSSQRRESYRGNASVTTRF